MAKCIDSMETRPLGRREGIMDRCLSHDGYLTSSVENVNPGTGMLQPEHVARIHCRHHLFGWKKNVFVPIDDGGG